MSASNANSSTCLQALIELKKAGFPVPDTLIATVRTDQHRTAKADKALQSHWYTDRSVQFVQLIKAILPRVAALSSEAAALLLLVILTTGLSGLFEISHQNIADYCKCRKAKVSGIIAELLAAQLIGTYEPSSGRKAAIYALADDVIQYGAKCSAAIRANWAAAEKSGVAIPTATWGGETVKRPDGVIYTRIIPDPPQPQETETQKKEPSGGTPNGSEPATQQTPTQEQHITKPAAGQGAEPQLSGQMTIYDYPEAIPADDVPEFPEGGL